MFHALLLVSVTVDRIKLPSGVDGTVQLTVGSGADHSGTC
jgi:hypothetical protein